MTPSTSLLDPLFLSFQAALAGRYSIDRELGRGGMGVVYLAREVHLDRLVAIKLLPPELSVRPALRDRFLREAQLAAKLSHPNIIPIHAVLQTDGFVYYVMAYVDGETLAQRVHSRGPVSASDGCRILQEVAWALSHAHGQGLVHRDVKPDNILIESASGRALVADFGIAAAAGDVLGDGVSGTPEFMSPEQALGRDVDARSDVYSLGVTAFFALTGKLPFSGKSATEVLAHQVTSPAPSVSAMGTSVPRKIAQLVDRCLAKDAAARPASAVAVAEQLGLAMERRRELPAALRSFVKRDGRMNGGGTIVGLTGTLVASSVVASTTSATTGALTFIAALAVIPVVFGIVAAKRLLDLGFTRRDLQPAFQREQETSREERNVQHQSGFSARSFVERLLRKVARASSVMCAVLIPFMLARMDAAKYGAEGSVIVALLGPVGSLVLLSLAVAVMSASGYLIAIQLRRDVDVEFWTSVWTGRFGALAFSVAGKLRGKKAIGAAMTHRATELSLGMAAEQLFEGLPKASRDLLGDVPSMLVRLQHDAHALRARFNALQDASSQLVANPADAAYRAVSDEREMVQEQLRVAVGALETLRLGLLRLHAGSLSLEGFTTHIALAADASADMERLVAAHAEVESALRFPMELQLTPV